MTANRQRVLGGGRGENVSELDTGYGCTAS